MSQPTYFERLPDEIRMEVCQQAYLVLQQRVKEIEKEEPLDEEMEAHIGSERRDGDFYYLWKGKPVVRIYADPMAGNPSGKHLTVEAFYSQ